MENGSKNTILFSALIFFLGFIVFMMITFSMNYVGMISLARVSPVLDFFPVKYRLVKIDQGNNFDIAQIRLNPGDPAVSNATITYSIANVLVEKKHVDSLEIVLPTKEAVLVPVDNSLILVKGPNQAPATIEDIVEGAMVGVVMNYDLRATKDSNQGWSLRRVWIDPTDIPNFDVPSQVPAQSPAQSEPAVDQGPEEVSIEEETESNSQ